MATPAPTTPDPATGNVGAQLAQIVAGLAAGGGAASGKFTWTPPGSVQRFDTTGIGRRLIGGGLVEPVMPLPESIDLATFGQRVNALTPEQLTTLQQQMYASGAYPASYYGKNAKPVPYGQLDQDTNGLLQQLGTLASFNGNLDRMLTAKVDIGAIGKAQRAPLVIELPSQDDMTAVLKDSAMTLLGRDPTPDELARYSASFTERVKAYQTGQYAAGEAGGTVTQAPNAQNAAEAMLQQSSPVEAGAQRIEKGLSALRQLFTGGGGGG